jgi:hypothetical protein
MGYNDENFEPMVIDIETTGRDGIDDLLDIPAAPANYKDPQKILDAKLEKLKAILDRAAIDIWLNRCTAIGIWTPSLGLSVVTCRDLDEEKLALATLAVVISNNGHRRRIVSFNGLHFDLANLIARARMHALQFPLTISDIVPAWKHAANDLMEVMTFQGKFAKRSLDFYCKVLGIDSDAPEDVKALNGADMPKLALEGHYDLIAAHCRHDVIRTVKLAQRMDVIRERGLQEDYTGRESGSDQPL